MRGCSSPFAAGLPGGRGRGAPPPLSTSHSPRHGGGWGWQNHERDDASSVGTGLDEERAEGTPMGDTRDLGANFDWMMPRVEAHARNAPPPSTCVEPDYRELIHSVSWVLSRRIADNEGFDSKKILPLFCEDTHTATPAEDRYGVEFPVFHQSCFATPTLYTLSRLPPLPTPPRLYPVPLASEVFEFVENIWHRARLTPQSLVICLVYVDRMEARSEGVLLHARSWRPIVFASLLLASKVWHDVSYWNSDFSTICPMFTVANINRMERAYLQLLDYNTIISPSQYATYYFSLRAASRQQEQAERSRQGSRADLSQLLDSPYASRRDSRLASLDASRHELEGVLRGPRPPRGGSGAGGGSGAELGVDWAGAAAGEHSPKKATAHAPAAAAAAIAAAAAAASAAASTAPNALKLATAKRHDNFRSKYFLAINVPGSSRLQAQSAALAQGDVIPSGHNFSAESLASSLKSAALPKTPLAPTRSIPIGVEPAADYPACYGQAEQHASGTNQGGSSRYGAGTSRHDGAYAYDAAHTFDPAKYRGGGGLESERVGRRHSGHAAIGRVGDLGSLPLPSMLASNGVSAAEGENGTPKRGSPVSKPSPVYTRRIRM